jgi:hypothetical protein
VAIRRFSDPRSYEPLRAIARERLERHRRWSDARSIDARNEPKAEPSSTDPGHSREPRDAATGLGEAYDRYCNLADGDEADSDLAEREHTACELSRGEDTYGRLTERKNRQRAIGRVELHAFAPERIGPPALLRERDSLAGRMPAPEQVPPFPAGSPAPHSPPVPICGSCGALATTSNTCGACGDALVRVDSPALAPIVWAAVRASFQCRSCGFQSPLSGVVVDEGVDCEHCGSFQHFDKGGWKAGLEGSHDVADLGGPYPEGRLPSPHLWIGDVNAYAKLGTSTTTFAVIPAPGIAVEACPGFPVCKACKRPLEVKIEAAAVKTTCGGCGATASYARRTAVAALASTVVGVVAEENREGRAHVQVHEGDAGVVAWTCPSCGAALVPGNAPTVTCAYCKTVAAVSARSRTKEMRRHVPPILFFVAFEGRSTRRSAFENSANLLGGFAVKAIAFRGLSPLPGIELARVRPGLDVKQLLLTIALSVFALGVGYLLLLLFT